MGVRLTLRARSSNVTYEFEQGRILIGRGKAADVRLPHRTVSSIHASIRSQGTGYAMVDEGSTNGTFVRGQRLVPTRPKLLANSDIIQIGSFRLTFECGIPVSAPTSADRTQAHARKLVEAASDALRGPRLIVLNGTGSGTTYDLPAPPARIRIGRGEHVELRLDDADCSREHAEIEVDLDGVVVRDMGSKNGLFVNDRRISARRIRHGDEILIGATVVALEEPAESMLAALEQEPDLVLSDPFALSESSSGGDDSEEPSDQELGSGGERRDERTKEPTAVASNAPAHAPSGVPTAARADGPTAARVDGPTAAQVDGPAAAQVDGPAAARADEPSDEPEPGKSVGTTRGDRPVLPKRSDAGDRQESSRPVRADTLIYAFAAIVILASLAGLYVLFDAR